MKLRWFWIVEVQFWSWKDKCLSCRWRCIEIFWYVGKEAILSVKSNITNVRSYIYKACLGCFKVLVRMYHNPRCPFAPLHQVQVFFWRHLRRSVAVLLQAPMADWPGNACVTAVFYIDVSWQISVCETLRKSLFACVFLCCQFQSQTTETGA